MARPQKNNADYFSHDNGMRNDPKVKALRRKFGTEGYSTWCMILEILTESEDFRFKWNTLSIELISADFDIDTARLREIVEYMILLQLLSFEEEHVFSMKLIDRFSGLLAKRTRDSNYDHIKSRANLQKIAISDSGNTPETEFPLAETSKNRVSVSENPQSKVKKSKVKDTKLNNYIPADFDEFYNLYPGTKRSVLTEYQNFCEKYNQDLLPLLLPGLEKEIKHHEYLKSKKIFEPGWKNLSTWINKSCWEQSFPSSEETLKSDDRPFRPSSQHSWSEKQQKWIIL